MLIVRAIQTGTIILLLLTLFSCTDYSPKGMFAAIDEGNIETVEKIMQKVPLNTCISDDGHNPLMYALTYQSYDVAEYLIPHSDLNFTNNKRNALMIAVSKSQIEIVKQLLEAGMEANYLNQSTGNWSLHDAVCQPNVEITKLLLKHGVELEVLTFGISPLQLAIMSGESEQAIFLLENGANRERKDMDGRNIFEACLADNNVTMLKHLIKEYDFNFTFAHYEMAMDDGNSEVVRCILESKLIDKATLEEQFPLITNLAICQVFLDHGVSINHFEKHHGFAAMHNACSKGNLPLLKLLHKNKADINLKVNHGEMKNHSPLMVAAHYSDQMVRMAEMLERRGGEYNGRYVVTSTNDTIYVKTKERSLELCKQLIEWGADAQYSCNGETALSVAIATNNDVVEAYLSNL